jgi:hypothetical protein
MQPTQPQPQAQAQVQVQMQVRVQVWALAERGGAVSTAEEEEVQAKE